MPASSLSSEEDRGLGQMVQVQPVLAFLKFHPLVVLIQRLVVDVQLMPVGLDHGIMDVPGNHLFDMSAHVLGHLKVFLKYDQFGHVDFSLGLGLDRTGRWITTLLEGFLFSKQFSRLVRLQLDPISPEASRHKAQEDRQEHGKEDLESVQVEEVAGEHWSLKTKSST